MSSRSVTPAPPTEPVRRDGERGFLFIECLFAITLLAFILLSIVHMYVLAGKQYALAGSYKNGLQIVDISNPDDAQIVSTYDCGVTQGDVQVFHQADEPGRTFVGYASDTFGDGTGPTGTLS